MRQKRAKSYRKQMLVYNHTFKFREPYQVIVDDTLVLTADKASFDLAKGLSRTIQSEVKPMITQCCMQELYKTKNQSAIELAKTFERRRCNHPPSEPLSPHECIKSIVIINGSNKHRYVVASDNEKLRWSLRKIPGVPLIYINRSVMVMEPLSKASAQVSTSKEESKLTGGLNDVSLGSNKEGEQVSKKRRGPKQPNPLSVKKKKVQKLEDTQTENPEQKKKRRRKHKSSGQTENEENENKNEDKNEGENNTENSGKEQIQPAPQANELQKDSEDN